MAETRITIVPHTHWDREWYQPFEAFLERLVAMMDSLLGLLEDGFPHFHLDGQVAMIDDYLEVRPDQEERIRRLVREGKLSAGPWYTQMDEFLVSGESHVRNLEWGLRRAGELGGELRAGYLPDQFGHVGQMPQLLSRAGLSRAVVWRGVPMSIDRTSFWWESPDGSRVLTEYLPFGYSIGMQIRDRDDPRDLAGALRDAVGWLEPMAVRERYLVTAGSDHHGPDATLPDRLRAVADVDPDLHVEIGSIAEHVMPDVEGDVPVWRGELRAAARAHLLPGVYSTRVHQKRERARVEALLERYAEPLAALVPGFEWPDEELDRAWRLLLWNGAHDSVCGCSVDEVARAVDNRHREAHELAGGIIGRALVALGDLVSSPGPLRFNPSPFERDGIPGLGWAVGPSPGPALSEPVSIREEGEWLEARGVRLRLADEPDVGDLYNFCPADRASPAGPTDISLDGREARLSFGPDLSARLAIDERSDGGSLRIQGVIANGRPDHRLRLVVELHGPVDRVVAGAPFELVERGLVSEGSDLEPPSPTWPARGVVLAGTTAVLHEGVFEYEVVDGRWLAVTLLRAVGTISRPTLATRPMMAGPDIATPEAQMLGDVEFRIAVMPGASRDDVPSAWERFALPIIARDAGGGGSMPDHGSLLQLEGAELSSVRRVAGGRVEVRVWNPHPHAAEATIDGRAIRLGPAEIRTLDLEGTG